MQKFHWTDKKYTSIAIYTFLTVAALIVFCLLLVNLNTIGGIVGSIFGALSSILYGIVIAFLCNPFYKCFLRWLAFVEKSKDRYSLRKVLAVFCTILSVLLIITAFISLLIPHGS